MLHPSYSDLMQVINAEAKEGGSPIVSSRYSIVMAAAKRARQLISGDEAYIHEDGRKPLSVAVEEIAESKVRILNAGSGDESSDEIQEEAAPEVSPEAVAAPEE